MVTRGQVLAEMDTAELRALLARAEAETALARQNKAEAEALVLQRQSELRLAVLELSRTQALVGKGHVSEALFDERKTARDVAHAVLGAAEAFVKTAESRIAVAEAEVLRIQTQIDDSRLIATADGRVLYRLAEPGEVVAGGAPVLTILSLANVYMEIFLPAAQSGLLPIGADARIVLDALPDFAIPAHVSFVSPEAQFTPKQVETLSEREKLVFRVKVRIDPERVRERIEHVKTGLRGMAYVKLDPGVDWPEALEQRIPDALFE
jgi:HlyD family secretion protein